MTITCFMVEEVDHDEPSHHWVRPDTNEVFGTRPVGAMWWSHMTSNPIYQPASAEDYSQLSPASIESMRDTFARYPQLYPGPSAHDPTLPQRQPSFLFADGPQLCVQTPGGSWVIDSRASNCTMPYDYAHRCWIRHGEPPLVTVDKNGQTCAAGGGSIQCGSYHGFLRNGELTPA